MTQDTPVPGTLPSAGQPLDRARGLAELAFASLTHASDPTQARHLALLAVESLELDLDDPAQRQFGDYELLERIGEGGMGVVYRARQVSLDREVAVKLLSAGPWASKEFIARFEREAQNSARMQHPAIVTVYEVGSVEGLQFFSMRLVRGESLSARLRRGQKLSPHGAVALMRTVAEAVSYAHSIGVLHLDLKPANVLLDEAGQPYVADFGLARRLENALAVDNDEVSGTPAYMAPEQAAVRAGKLTAATDIWGLGAILYELLTGRPPFRADNAQDTVRLVREGRVRLPRRYCPRLSLDLQAIVMRCLAREPAQRYPSARAVADDLARFMEGRPVRARPLNAGQKAWRWTRREPKLAATLACAVAALLVGLVVSLAQWHRADASANAARESLWTTRAQTAQAAFADGDGFRALPPLIANLSEMERAGDVVDGTIERQRIGTILANAPQLVNLVRLPAGEQATAVAIAPDGRHFAVATERDGWIGGVRHVRQYDLDTLRETWSASPDDHKFAPGTTHFESLLGSLHYTADGRWLLASAIEQQDAPAPRWSGMTAFDARDGRVLWPGTLPRQRADVVYDRAARLALVRYRSDPSQPAPEWARFFDVADWQPVDVGAAYPEDFRFYHWLPAPGGRTWLGTRDSVDFTLYGVPRLTPHWHLRLPLDSPVRAWRFSPDGKWLALGSVDGAVRVVDVATGRARKVASGPIERIQRVEFGPDGRTLAAIDQNGSLWAWDVASGLPRMPPLRLARGPLGYKLRFAGDMLFAGNLTQHGPAVVDYASLAPRALFNVAAVPGAAPLHGDTSFGTAFDVSETAHRLVFAAGGGLLEVWRTPPSPLLVAHAAPLPSDVLDFDGRRVVDTEGATVRIVDAASGAPLSPEFRHPEPVRFAELSPAGDALVTIAGRTVRVIDAHDWRLRGAPIVLPETPIRVVFAQAAPVLVVTTRSYERGALREHIQRIDLVHATLLPGPTVGALIDLAIDAHGRYAMIETFGAGNQAEPVPRRVALDGTGGTCVPRLKHAWGFTLAPDGHTGWLAVTTAAGLVLHRFDLDACREIAVASQSVIAMNAVLLGRGGGLAVSRGGMHALVLIGPDGKQQAALGDAIPDAMHDFALSADGTRAAFATRNTVYLIDAHRGRRLSAPLVAPIGGDDGIAALAFSPDGTRLLARTINRRWLYWNLPQTHLGTATLDRLARVFDPDPAHELDAADIATLRAELRAQPQPLVPAPVQAAPVSFAPAPGAGVEPRYVPLDLAAAINVPLLGAPGPDPDARGDRPTLAPGPQRFLGVDYRVDGGVQLSGGGGASVLAPELQRSAIVKIPDIVASRIYLLAFTDTRMDPGAPSRPFARVVLIGKDGHEAHLDIRTVRDVATDITPSRGAPTARIAFSAAPSAFVRGGEPDAALSNVYEVALTVPAGIGPLRGLRFEVADGATVAPLFYAATLERASVH